MNKTKIVTIFLSLFIIGMLLFVVIASKNRSKNLIMTKKTKHVFRNEEIIFFYGNTCPHCKETENWMEENEIEGKIRIIKKEVYDNRENAKNLEGAAQNCGLSTESIGVPFLYAKGRCFVGKDEIINYLTLEVEKTDKVEMVIPKEEECCTY